MRRFQLVRHEDVTGVSGTGVVAEGCTFSDGSGAVRWLVGPYHSTVSWDPPTVLEALEAVHGHSGRTEIVYLDPEEIEDTK
jgi:hypothetical protein